VSNTSVSLLVVTAVFPLGLFVAHVAYCRLRHFSRSGSPQTALTRLIVLGTIPLLSAVALIARAEARSVSELSWMMFFALFVYGAAGYAYFHVFNMSETARRIRILIEILQHGALPADALRDDYSPERMIRVRLDRLLKMRQIRRQADGLYRIDRKLLVTAAKSFRVFRHVLFAHAQK
jgi:hypothetical protein